jgi:tripartite ATP-independent transporter DctM subunit
MMHLLGLAVVFVVALLVGMPVAFALGFAGLIYILQDGSLSLDVVPTVLFGGMDSFPLLAIPLFIMAGDLLSRAGLLQRLIRLAMALIGPVRGSLAHVDVLSSMLFGGITGVSLADVAAVGGTLVPAMVREGYNRAFAAGLTAAASVMGAIIPPSVAMLIVAYIFGGHLSIARMFLSGIVPGILIGGGMMAMVALLARRLELPRGTEEWSLGNVGREFRRGILALGVPVTVIGGILSGYFTATEAGAIAVAYALLVGGLVYRSLGLRDIVQALLGSAKMSAMVFLLLANAKLISFILVINQIPHLMVAAIEPYVTSPQLFMLGVTAIFLLLGFVLDGIAVMIMLVPIVAPMGISFGVEPHHMALVIVMAVQVALVTPPVALAFFVVAPIAGCSLMDAAKASLPFTAVTILVIVAVIFVPGIAMWVPRLAGY